MAANDYAAFLENKIRSLLSALGVEDALDNKEIVVEPDSKAQDYDDDYEVEGGSVWFSAMTYSKQEPVEITAVVYLVDRDTGERVNLTELLNLSSFQLNIPDNAQYHE